MVYVIFSDEVGKVEFLLLPLDRYPFSGVSGKRSDVVKSIFCNVFYYQPEWNCVQVGPETIPHFGVHKEIY